MNYIHLFRMNSSNLGLNIRTFIDNCNEYYRANIDPLIMRDEIINSILDSNYSIIDHLEYLNKFIDGFDFNQIMVTGTPAFRLNYSLKSNGYTINGNCAIGFTSDSFSIGKMQFKSYTNLVEYLAESIKNYDVVLHSYLEVDNLYLLRLCLVKKDIYIKNLVI